MAIHWGNASNALPSETIESSHVKRRLYRMKAQTDQTETGGSETTPECHYDKIRNTDGPAQRQSHARSKATFSPRAKIQTDQAETGGS